LDEMAPEKGENRLGPRNESSSKGLNLGWVPEG